MCHVLQQRKYDKSLGMHVLQLLFLGLNGFRFSFAHFLTNQMQVLGHYSRQHSSLHQHVMNVCRVGYLELRHINSIRNLLSVDAVTLQYVHLCCLILTIATLYLLVFLSILLRGFKEFKMQQPHQYLEHPDLSTSHQSFRTFIGCLSIAESCTRLLHYVILHYLALALNICLIFYMFTPLPDPGTLPQIPIS